MTTQWFPARVRAALMVMACAVAVAACSSSGSTAVNTTAAPSTSVVAPSKPITFDPAENARSEVAFTACAPKAGAWVVTGTVTNSGSATKTFQLVVDFASVPGSTVVSSTLVTVPDVEKHATVHWSARGARGASHVTCLLRQAQAS